jgi:hypothetical protein
LKSLSARDLTIGGKLKTLDSAINLIEKYKFEILIEISKSFEKINIWNSNPLIKNMNFWKCINKYFIVLIKKNSMPTLKFCSYIPQSKIITTYQYKPCSYKLVLLHCNDVTTRPHVVTRNYVKSKYTYSCQASSQFKGLEKIFIRPWDIKRV